MAVVTDMAATIWASATLNLTAAITVVGAVVTGSARCAAVGVGLRRFHRAGAAADSAVVMLGVAAAADTVRRPS
jgi:hypothetical protein